MALNRETNFGFRLTIAAIVRRLAECEFRAAAARQSCRTGCTISKGREARYSPGTAIVDLSKADSPRLRALALVSRSVMRALTVRQFGGGKPSARQRVRIS